MQRSRISARVSSIDEGAAAGRDHPGRPLDQPGDHPALAVAEMGLAEPLENLGDAQARRRLDLRVGIDEGQAEPLRQPPADGRLARAHQPDERDRAFRRLVARPPCSGGYTERAALGQKARHA